jgi:hypothetical protein
LPSVQTIASKLNVLGFRLRTVVKSRPQKKPSARQLVRDERMTAQDRQQ